jgi:hypothetical protein
VSAPKNRVRASAGKSECAIFRPKLFMPYQCGANKGKEKKRNSICVFQMRGNLPLWMGGSIHSFSEIKITSSDIVPAKACVEDNPERSEGFLLPYRRL